MDGPLADIEALLGRHGLIARGGFSFRGDEARPRGPSGKPANSVLLVGHAGGTIWPHFSSWRKRQEAGLANPLDAWSREVIGDVATDVGARALFPFDKPYWPFQQWAMRAEGLKASPLGMLIHPRYGLWHAYRGALVFDEAFVFGPAPMSQHPCDSCDGKPCLTACPVGAFSQSGYDVAACRSHLDSGMQPDCMTLGCRARDACPVGNEWRYGDDQVRFHMAAFAGRT